MQNKWINVNEKLPENLKRVIGLLNGKIAVIYLNLDEWELDYDLTYGLTRTNYINIDRNVTHWSPLPDDMLSIV